MNVRHPLRVLLVDPSLFTAPYDAALTRGLLEAGVEPSHDGSRCHETQFGRPLSR